MSMRMMKVALGAAAGLSALLLVATPAYGTLPAGTKVTAALKAGTTMNFKGSIDSVPITVTCTHFSGSGKVPATASNTVTLATPPTLSGCTDTSGGADTVVTNQTNGKWKLTEGGTAGAYTMTLMIPKAGATFTSNIITGCTITAAPSGTASVKGSYDGTNTDTVSGAKIPTKGSGCTSTAAATTATVVFTPSPGPPPF
jgi:hypothetical protein